MRRKRSTTHPSSSQPRPVAPPHEAPPGGAAGKPPEATACPDCGATHHDGRWTWRPAPAGAPEARCPACERIAQDYPAGLLRVEGAFAREHRDEILARIHHVEERERTEHPLKRLMGIDEDEQGMTVKTTDAKLARSLGTALRKAFKGELEAPKVAPDPGEVVRVRWCRD